MKGYHNKVLRIDLTNRSHELQHISDDILSEAIGGKGFGIRTMLAEIPAGADALSSENVVVIATGPATGTRMWGRSRFGVYSKSPATGGFGESYCGGTLAPKIKGCGFDFLVIKGKADKLTWLAITEEGVEFNDAAPIKGFETDKAEARMLEQSPKGAGAMVIGPAGENLITFACIKSDRWRSLGRGGMGAVFGSKNLKGITFSGRQSCSVADQSLLQTLIKAVSEKGNAAPVTKMYQKHGTPMQVKVTNAQGCFPTRYWRSGRFDKWENLSADYMQENFDLKSIGCPPCFLRCTKHSVVKNGRHRGLELEGPEYETIYAIGGLNAIDSLEEVAWLNDLCDRLGLDTMSGGNISAFAIEAYKAGKIDFAIDYNQPDRVAELFELIANREGIGALFARGIVAVAAELGLDDLAVHVKGLEPAGFDPRVLKGMGLSYATAARGACHLRATFYKAELSGEFDRDKIAGKALAMIDYEDRATLFDSLILCRFFRDFVMWDELEILIEATTGVCYDKEALQKIAGKTANLAREFNRREGLDETYDKLPKRFFEKNEEGAVLSKEEMAIMLGEYNKLRKAAA